MAYTILPEMTGLDYCRYWTGLLDSPKNVFSSLFQCRREANHVYSAYFFAKFKFM